MTIDRQAPPLGARARAGLLLTTLLLAAALVGAAWGNYLAARGAVNTLNAGQADLLTRAVHAAEPPGGFEGSPDSLAAVLESQREAGIRYLAVLDFEGRVVASAGESVAPVALPPGASGNPMQETAIVPVGERIRAFDVHPMGRGGGGPSRPSPADSAHAAARTPADVQRDLASLDSLQARVARGEFDRLRESAQARAAAARAGAEAQSAGASRAQAFGRGGRPPLGYTLIEFEPVPASELMAEATFSLGLSGVGAAILTLVALVFWRQSRRYDEVRRHAEQQKRLSQLGEMSAVLAHEIRNPLASLKGNAQLLAEGLEGGTRERRRADRVVSEAIRLESLTTDLLDFARSGSVTREPVDPAALLRLAAEEATNGGGATLETGAAPALWSLDAARLRQALVNLIGNAAQVSPEGKPPVAEVAETGGSLVYTVRDFGPGIRPGDEERIFEPFYTTRTHGTGLGLAVSRRVVELHGGTLTAGNHAEGGAVFTIVLPRAS